MCVGAKADGWIRLKLGTEIYAKTFRVIKVYLVDFIPHIDLLPLGSGHGLHLAEGL